MSATLALAVDLGGTKVEAALVDSSGLIRPGSRHRRPTGPAASSEDLARAVTDAVRAALAGLERGDELVGTGIGSAGPLDSAVGAVSPLNLPAWRGYPLRDLVAESVTHSGFEAPVVLAIDGLAITLAEAWIGAAAGQRNVMGMIVSTGVGGGLILDGRAVPGPSGNAGHIGHVEVAGHDEPCVCGGHGCLEAVASGPKTVAWAQQQGWAGNTGEELAVAHAAADPIARAAVHRAGRAIGQAVASASSLVDLDVVAIGGGFANVAPEIFDAIREAVAERHALGFVMATRVVPSALGDAGPLIGAAALIHRGADG